VSPIQAPKFPIALVFACLFILAATASPLKAQTSGAQAYTVQRGLAYQNAKDWNGMVRYATAWTQAQPNSVDAWGLLGNAYTIGLNQPDKGIDPLKHAVALAPNSAPAWHALGATYVMAKDYRNGVDAIKRAIQINPNQPTYYNNLAAAYAGGAAWGSALAAFDQEKPLAQRLNNANVWYVLGNGYAKLADLPNAIAAYRAALAMMPAQSRPTIAVRPSVTRWPARMRPCFRLRKLRRSARQPPSTAASSIQMSATVMTTTTTSKQEQTSPGLTDAARAALTTVKS